MAMSVFCLLFLAIGIASPVPEAHENAYAASLLEARQTPDNASSSLLPYTIPNGVNLLRAADIATKQATFTYGPAVGAGPYYPAGVLGTAYDTLQSAEDDVELTAQEALVVTDAAKATLDSAKYNGLQTLDDYTKLYDGEWTASSAPTGIYSGVLTNYTQDLLFSMGRLSFSPYAVSRLIPGTDSVPFTISDSITTNLTGQTLEELFTSGSLFYVNHSIQAVLPKNPPPKYSAACDALFYISPSNGDFLPLAIRTNWGSNLIYTPADTADDWLLAKIMFNVNDFFFAQFDHFARTHFVAEIVFEAAIRTLSDDHPVLAIINRLLYGAFGIRPLALLVLLRPGGQIDEYFGNSGAAAATFSNDDYFNGYGGALKSNYFLENLQKRGLLNSTIGPPLKNFPFYEDGAAIMGPLRTFTGSFVDSYYANDAALANDNELQAWINECNGPAKVIDFPDLTSPSDLADLLAEIARLVSFAHHGVNLNQLLDDSGVLPFYNTALYKPIPTAKGITDVASWLPPEDVVIGLISVGAGFARPLLAYSNRTLVNMFNDPAMLYRMNDATRSANDQFMDAMNAQSQVIASRTFDANGLSQGMPFVWKALQPNVIPWSLSI